MRGLMFNYLLNYLESIYDYEFVDEVIENSGLSNDGSYADGGVYPDEDLLHIIIYVSEKVLIEPEIFLERFGEWLFNPLFVKLGSIYDRNAYRQSTIQNAFDFLVMLNTIHYKEVVKLYPESIFPHFDVLERNADELQIEYRSERRLHHLAKGMLIGCGIYFNETFHIEMKPADTGTAVKFTISKLG